MVDNAIVYRGHSFNESHETEALGATAMEQQNGSIEIHSSKPSSEGLFSG